MYKGDGKVILSVKEITKSFGAKRVLTNVSFDVHEGEIFGLLGPNGSGKTTTIKLALGLLNIQGGSVKICDYDVTKEFESAISNVGAIIENPEMYKYLTGKQNLLQYCRMYSNISQGRLEWVIKTVGLENRINEKISRYSLGMRQRLGIAQALLNSPKLLVLDEPTNGLDPEGIKQLRELLLDLAHNQNVAVVVSSHLLLELENLCDTVGVINSGRIIAVKTMDEIKSYNNSNCSYFKLKAVEPQLAIDYFTANSIKYKINRNKTITIEIEKERADTIIKDLAMAGIMIQSFTPLEKSLEEAFMEMISQNGGSKI